MSVWVGGGESGCVMWGRMGWGEGKFGWWSLVDAVWGGVGRGEVERGGVGGRVVE